MSLRNDLIRHQVFLQRLIKSEVNAITPTIVRARVIAADLIDKGLSRESVNKQIYNIMKLLYDLIISRMTDIVSYETRFTFQLLYKHLEEGRRQGLVNPVNKNSARRLKQSEIKLTITKPPVKIEKIITSFIEKKTKEMTDLVVDAPLKQEEPSRTKELLVLLTTGLIASQVSSLITTLVNKASSIGKAEVFEANKDFIEYVVWSTELDAFVCPYCEDLEGTEMSTDEFDDQFPAHGNCRCHGEPVLQ